MMNTKKSIFSYFLWILFAILNGASLAVYLYAGVLTKYFSEFTISAGIIAAVFAAFFIIFFVFRKICSSITGTDRKQKSTDISLAGIIPPVVILAGAVVRLTYYIAFHIPIVIKNSTYYYQAVVTDSHHGLIFAAHGLTQFYTAFLHVLFLVFGNEPLAGIIAQIVFYFASLVFLFFGVKMMAGYVPALIAMAFMAFLPDTYSYVFSLSPEMAGLFFYTTGLCAAGMIVSSFARHRYRSFGKCIPVFFTGMYFALLLYFDIYMAVLLLFVFGLYRMENTRKARHNAILLMVLELLGAAAGAGAILGVMFLLGMTPVEYFHAWIKLYFERISINPWASSPDNTSMAVSLILIGCSFFLIPGFIVQKRNRSSFFILALVLIILLPVLSINSMDDQLFISLAWSIMAGLGIQSLILVESKSRKDSSSEFLSEEPSDDSYDSDSASAENSLKNVFTISQPVEKTPAYDKMILFVKEPSEYEKTEEPMNVLPVSAVSPVSPASETPSETLSGRERPCEALPEAEAAGSETNSMEEENAGRTPETENMEDENTDQTPEEDEDMSENNDYMEAVSEEDNQETVEDSEEMEEDNADMELVENGPELIVKVKPLDNPLPLPKKHVRKDMDYSFDVPDKLMNYDHEISESDNYDYD